METSSLFNNYSCRHYNNYSCLIKHNIGCSFSAMKYDLEKRRQALKPKVSQTELARLVSERAGKTFSQQSYSKLVKNPQAESRFLHYILEVLEEREGRKGMDEFSVLAESYRNMTPEQRKALVSYAEYLERAEKEVPQQN